MDLIRLLVFNRSHLHELVHNAFDYSFTIVLVRFLPFHPVKHLHRKEPKLREQVFEDYDILYQVIFPVFVNLKHAVLHVVVHVVDLVHPLHAVDHHLSQPPRLA